MNLFTTAHGAVGERVLAGRVAAALWLVSGLSVPLLLLVPGLSTDHAEVVIALGGASTLWGLAAATVVPWERAGAIVFHAATVAALVVSGVLVAATGGSGSPVWIFLLYVAAYSAYFYTPAWAGVYLVCCPVVMALPFVYESGAVQEDLADVLIAGPAFLLVGAIIVGGKLRLLAATEAAHDLSLADSLTGLANRRALMERLASVGGGRAGDATGLLLVDVDDFKDANTLHGHPVGDLVLQEVARLLQSSARAEDMVARLGGDEFAVVVSSPVAEALHGLAERVLAAVRAANEHLDLPGFTLTASMGWALYPQDAADGQGLVRAADLALRAAKVQGKDRYQRALAPLPERTAAG